ncbi:MULTISPECIES: hypothetical protein [Neobacillus]|uniref:Uncharacterized protein n=1 Tax=Neobacillus rhizophilus TaxID=2833579 RepID=A0A942U2Y3_9BACI|nr:MULTISPECIES: hypothetical protein [Neobacillus]MBS4211518.1 hypothetical protein [Neobacillus rhizophilus]MBU8916936.1 hypothetical protein [Bacillus sp. FJAT-29953]
MGKWNEQAAPNNNLHPKTIKTSNLVQSDTGYGFSEELSDGGERDEYIERQQDDFKMK